MINDDAIVSETIEFEIPFFDVDSMEVTWHGHYIKYFELARCALLKKILILLLPLFFISASYADDVYSRPLNQSNQAAFNQVQSQLSKADNLSGDFKQIRKMRLLSQPLTSTGHFILSKKDGLKWYQTAPFNSSLIVTDTTINQTIENTPPTIITQKDQPIVFSFTHIFLSIFNGNTKAIKDYFNIYFTGNTSAWEIALKPTNPLLKKAIESIEMIGGKTINTITMNEAKQNQMIMQFSNVKIIQKIPDDANTNSGTNKDNLTQ